MRDTTPVHYSRAVIFNHLCQPIPFMYVLVCFYSDEREKVRPPYDIPAFYVSFAHQISLQFGDDDAYNSDEDEEIYLEK